MTLQNLLKVLTQLKSEALMLIDDSNEADWQTLTQKYDMLFLGKNFNIIYSNELAQMLRAKENVDISLEELNAMLPSACAVLDMKVEPLIKASDAGSQNPPTYCYEITLF